MATTSRMERATAIADMIDASHQPQKLAQQIAAYLVSEHQTKDLDSIMRDVMTIRARRGTVEATITTAFPLSTTVESQVNALLKTTYPQAKHVVTSHRVKPEVLSGLKIQTHDKQLDETARGKLDNLVRAAA